MKFKIGDFVRFVDEAIEGHITSFHSEEIMGVTDESGFEIPVHVSKVTAVHGDMKRADDEEVETAVPTGQFIEKGVYIAVTGEQREGLARFHVINETSFRLVVAISEVQGTKHKGQFASILSARSTEEFYTANFSAVGKWPTFSVRIIKYTDSLQTAHRVIEEEVKIKAGQINQSKGRLDLLSEKAWIFPLDAEKKDIGLDRLKQFGK
ncbi:hypothetical protein ACFSQ3_15715 [Sphingobacterium corticis]|uniref:Uncharacterized protein n=1 Tax=Sphingobacterium corticis TaxID=1812823 RepID=A0ABW5NMZ0_9SPHI